MQIENRSQPTTQAIGRLDPWALPAEEPVQYCGDSTPSDDDDEDTEDDDDDDDDEFMGDTVVDIPRFDPQEFDTDETVIDEPDAPEEEDAPQPPAERRRPGHDDVTRETNSPPADTVAEMPLPSEPKGPNPAKTPAAPERPARRDSDPTVVDRSVHEEKTVLDERAPVATDTIVEADRPRRRLDSSDTAIDARPSERHDDGGEGQ